MNGDFPPDAAEFRCLVPFPDQSESFVLGFEAGIIWQRMAQKEQIIGGLNEVATHSENETVFQRMADAQGYDLDIAPCDSEWIIATFTKRQNRLRLVHNDPGRTE